MPLDEKAEEETIRVLRLGVYKEQYVAATGPPGKSRTFSQAQVRQGIRYVSKLRQIQCLYVVQINSLLNLFEGRHVVSRLVTSVGKTFAYECVGDFYDYLFNGDPSNPSYVRSFCPVTWVVGPLVSLMVEQVTTYNAMMVRERLPARAAHVSVDQKDKHVIGLVKSANKDISIVHISIEKAVDKKLGFRPLLQAYGCRLVLVVCEEAHTVSEWKHKFREKYKRIGELRSLAPNCVWTVVSATLTPSDVATLMTDLSISDYVSLQGLFTRPNIFLDRREIKDPGDLEAALQPFIEELMQDGSEAGLFTHTCLLLGHPDPHRREALCVCDLWQGFCSGEYLDKACPDAHRREALCVCDLWQGFCSGQRLDEA